MHLATVGQRSKQYAPDIAAAVGTALSGAVMELGTFIAVPLALVSVQSYMHGSTAAAYGMLCMAVYFLAGAGRAGMLGLRRPRGSDMMLSVGTAVCLYPAMTCIAAVCAVLFPDSTLHVSSTASEAIDAMAAWERLAVFAVWPALGEEALCRGLLYGAARRYGVRYAVILPAVCFAVLHGNLQQAAYAFVFGCVLGCIREYTGSLWPCISAHAAFNSVSMLSPGVIVNVRDFAVYAGGLLPMAAALLVLMRGNAVRELCGHDDGECPNGAVPVIGTVLGLLAYEAIVAATA